MRYARLCTLDRFNSNLFSVVSNVGVHVFRFGDTTIPIGSSIKRTLNLEKSDQKLTERPASN